MKTIVSGLILFFSQAVLAHPNILCFSYGHPEAMQTEVVMGVGRVGDQAVLTNAALGAQETGGGNALCTRTLSEKNSEMNQIEVARFVVYEDGMGPLADTCNFEPGTRFDVLERKTVEVRRGESVEVSMPIQVGLLKIVNYVPTAKEIALWQSNPEQIVWLAQKKCYELVPNSELLPGSFALPFNLNVSK